jgi:hypothetical protein
MAIVKTNFDSGSSNISQVAAWLQANATDYFDEISISGSTITCTKDSHTAFVMTDTDDARYRMYISNGTNVTLWGGKTLFGVSTSKGLLLRSVGKSDTDKYNYTDIIITKTNEDGLAFVAAGVAAGPSGSYSSCYYYAIDFNSITLVPWIATDTNVTPSYCIPNKLTLFDVHKTSMANIMCKNADSYTPDVYQIDYSQYSYDTTGKFTKDGKEYYTNGCFAIAD